MRTLKLIVLLLLLGVGPHAIAATVYCVNTVETLQAALTTAESNGDDDYINVHWGVYSLSSELLHSSSENRNLSIQGGWDDGCNSIIGESLLHGNDTVRPLSIFVTGGSVAIRRMYFAHGFTNGAGGGLQVVGTSALIILDKNRFTDNRSLGPAGAAQVSTGTGRLFAVGNLVWQNRGGSIGGLNLGAGGESVVLNNTIFSNITDSASAPGGVLVQGSGSFDVANNIIWNNAPPGGADFRGNAPHGRRNNDIGFIASATPPDYVTDELSVDPMFASCTLFCVDLDLDPASPLVDAGNDEAWADFNPGELDLLYRPRFAGAHVDIGAYENNDLLFADGFDP
ncbi:MAG: hypothetical protein E6R11_02815 [Rhodocyclaceae bacterium]|nr:MAG: hypothetical protein E6R11_02815 [Rhodocyclaceae bacterium]